MVEFNMWTEAFKMAGVYSAIIIISCFFAILVGRKMIIQLGLYPSQAPQILLKIFWKFLFLEICSIGSLIIFYQVLAY